MTIKLTELKRVLKDLDQKELIQLITELYKLNEAAKEYLSVRFSGEESIIDLFKKTQKLIKDEFFPDRGDPKMRLGEAKRSITNFKKITNDPIKTLDLMLYYVEVGTKFTATYGDIDERFYTSMMSMFEKVCDACQKEEVIYKEFNDRMYSVVEAADGIGWGYHDYLEDRYYAIQWGWAEDEDI